jgi:dipeptidyl aminopeptidase/acylaminoacyl peptidase
MRLMPTPRAMAPQDLTRIRFVSDPQIAPDGRTVAFVVTTLSEEKDEYLSQHLGGEHGRQACFDRPRQDTTPLVARRPAKPSSRARARQKFA